MGKIRILQVIGGNEIGGAEEHVLALCKGLDKAKFDILLICLCEGPLHHVAEQQNVPVRTVNMRSPFDLSVIPKLKSIMQTERIDVVHTHGSRANLTARLAARWLGLPIITTVHSSLSEDYTRKTAAALALILDRITTPLTFTAITISDYLQTEVKRRGAKQIVTIYNGIDSARFRKIAPSSDIYSELGIDSTTPLVAAVGRLHPVKGLNFFLQAAAIVSSRHPKVKFLLAGSGPMAEELHRLTQSLGLERKVIFTGYYQEIERIMSVLDILCLPSLAEGMGLVLLEAMYYAKPVIASAVGGIPELVTHEANGLLVAPGDSLQLAAAINRLLDDKTLATNLGVKGQQTFTRFSLTNMLKQTAEVYEAASKTSKSHAKKRNA
ncbi:MAG: glycosyltransferase family 4 protein [Peptococcaceae bacterium]|nr:glycosyltransferase family 4 protein [Peptococcaceae bacterium]